MSDIKAFYTGGAHIQNGVHACNLTASLVDSGYLSSLPTDPVQGTTNNSGYLIKRDPLGSVSVKAPYASQYATQEISVSQ